MTKELTILSPGGAVTIFEPDQAKEKLAKIEVLAAYAIQVKNEDLLEKAVAAKKAQIAELVEWWEANVRRSGPEAISNTPVTNTLTQEEAEQTLGFGRMTVSRWRKALARGDFEQVLLEKWLRAAGLLAPEEKAESALEPEWSVERLVAFVEDTIEQKMSRERGAAAWAALVAKGATIKPYVEDTDPEEADDDNDDWMKL